MRPDWAVVGHGLAGAAVAARLRARGASVAVLCAGGGASRVAGGLVSPVTGPRLAPVPRWADWWAAAVAFYRHAEAETGRAFFHPAPLVRLFPDPETRAAFLARPPRPGVRALPDPPLDPDAFAAAFGGVRLEPAGRLDVPAFLDGSRYILLRSGSYRAVEPRTARDFRPGTTGVAFPQLGMTAGGVVFCEGFTPGGNPLFPNARVGPLVGEVLTVRVPGLSEPRVLHGGVWLVPIGGDLYRVGATHDRTRADSLPTATGRESLEKLLRSFLHRPFEVVGHAAGVRPATPDAMPVVGVHPDFPRVGLLNGLGSKGVLLAPFYAEQLVAALHGEVTIDRAADVRRFDPPGGPFRVADRAHAVVRGEVQAGEIAIDATAGNGRDTAFLAGLVGPAGTVFAFDVQPLALERTARRLDAGGFANAELLLRDHATMADALPGSARGRVAAVMFHLGFLPGGDRSRTTAPASTAAAVRAAATLLRPGGVLTVAAFGGHPGGGAEADAVRAVLADLPSDGFTVTEQRSDGSDPSVPVLFVVRGEAGQSARV